MEELVVPGREEWGAALQLIESALAMLDTEQRCSPTTPLLWVDVCGAAPPSAGGAA